MERGYSEVFPAQYQITCNKYTFRPFFTKYCLDFLETDHTLLRLKPNERDSSNFTLLCFLMNSSLIYPIPLLVCFEV